MKTPTGYVALKKGRNVRNCIFLNWCDAEEEITDFDEAEFSVIDSLQDAEKFIINANNDLNNMNKDTLHLNTSNKSSFSDSSIDANTNANTTKKIAASSPPPLPRPATATIDIDAAALNKDEIQQKPRDSETKLPSGTSQNRVTVETTTPCVPVPVQQSDISETNSNKEKNITKSPLHNTTISATSRPQTVAEVTTATKHNDKTVGLSRSKKITKNWKTNFDKLASYRRLNGTYPTPIPDENIRKWLCRQKSEYCKKLCGLDNSMYDEREELLQSIGISFNIDNVNPTNPSTASPFCLPKKRKEQQENLSPDKRQKKRAKCARPSKSNLQVWKDNLAKLKQYMDSHDGDWDVNKNDDPKLRSWILKQKAQYVRMKEGKSNSIDEEKIAMLHEIGVDFDKNLYTWSERIEQLKQYKKEFGDLKIPRKHPVLGEWAKSMIRQYKRIQAGLPVKILDMNKIDELRKAGFDFSNDLQPQIQQEWDDEFEKMFVRLKEYKDKYGNCDVKPHREYFDVYKWCFRKVQNEYRKLSDKDTANRSRLSTRQMVRLTEIGFQFKLQVDFTRKTFEKRIEQLKEYQKNGGDINSITCKEDSGLGLFVRRQRNDYRLWCKGETSRMNKERIKILEGLGFDWNVEKWVDPNWVDPVDRGEIKTWDERFQQLLDYKTKHGHVIVPQSTKDGLGQWVKAQRKNYKLMLEGKKSSMNAEKALRLSNIGFIFDASSYRFKRNRSSMNDKQNNYSSAQHHYMNDDGDESDSE